MECARTKIVNASSVYNKKNITCETAARSALLNTREDYYYLLVFFFASESLFSISRFRLGNSFPGTESPGHSGIVFYTKAVHPL